MEPLHKRSSWTLFTGGRSIPRFMMSELSSLCFCSRGPLPIGPALNQANELPAHLQGAFRGGQGEDGQKYPKIPPMGKESRAEGLIPEDGKEAISERESRTGTWGSHSGWLPVCTPSVPGEAMSPMTPRSSHRNSAHLGVGPNTALT